MLVPVRRSITTLFIKWSYGFNRRFTQAVKPFIRVLRDMMLSYQKFPSFAQSLDSTPFRHLYDLKKILNVTFYIISFLSMPYSFYSAICKIINLKASVTVSWSPFVNKQVLACFLRGRHLLLLVKNSRQLRVCLYQASELTLRWRQWYRSH